jgi:hypothetical protein
MPVQKMIKPTYRQPVPLTIKVSFSDKLVKLKTGTWLARIAAINMQSRQIAIVWGNSIHLHGVSVPQFLQHRSWVNHELAHVQQYQQQGHWRFVFKYLEYWMTKGYYHNPFEVAARKAESSPPFDWTIVSPDEQDKQLAVK